jgi:hypothetical protein
MSSHASYRANHIRSINHLCNTKCVWSIPLWMEAPHQGRQGHTHQVSCYYFCSYIIRKDNQKRLTWLVCGSPSNSMQSFRQPRTYLLNFKYARTWSQAGCFLSRVQSNPEEQSGGCTDLGNDVIRCHCAHSCTRRSDRLTDRMWYKNSHGAITNQYSSLPLLTSV